MSYEFIKVGEENKVARITLNKPPLNVLDIAMMKEINDALKGFAGRNLKALVIDAEGKAFSAGVDVSEHTADKVQEMIEVFHKIFTNRANNWRGEGKSLCQSKEGRSHRPAKTRCPLSCREL